MSAATAKDPVGVAWTAWFYVRELHVQETGQRIVYCHGLTWNIDGRFVQRRPPVYDAEGHEVPFPGSGQPVSRSINANVTVGIRDAELLCRRE
jgi:hypothetical protein